MNKLKFSLILCTALIASSCGKKADNTATLPTGAMTSSMEAVPPPEPIEYPLKPEYLESLSLTEKMRAAIVEHNPDFKEWDIAAFSSTQTKHYHYSDKNLPFAVKGDYNGDGIEDLAISGHDLDGNLILVLLASGDKYSVMEAAKSKAYKLAREKGTELAYTPGAILFRIKKGEKVQSCSDSTVSYKTLPRDGIMQINEYYDATLYELDTSLEKFTTYCAWCENASCLK